MLVLGESLQRGFGHGMGAPSDNDNVLISEIALTRPDTALTIED